VRRVSILRAMKAMLLVMVLAMMGCVGTVVESADEPAVAADEASAPVVCGVIFQSCEEPVTGCPGRCARRETAEGVVLYCLAADGCP
jgi:hypothetical protein